MPKPPQNQSVVAYHGTTKDFKQFKRPHPSKISNYGSGLYFAEDPEEANAYAQVDAHHSEKVERERKKLEADPQYKKLLVATIKKHGLAHEYDVRHPNHQKFWQEWGPRSSMMLAHRVGGAPNVKKVKLDVKNPFDPHNYEHAQKVAQVTGHKYDQGHEMAKLNTKKEPFSVNHYEVMVGDALGWNEKKRHSDFFGPKADWKVKTKMLNEAIQRAGFDAIHDRENKHIVVFDPKKVKNYFAKSLRAGMSYQDLAKIEELEKGAMKRLAPYNPRKIDPYRELITSHWQSEMHPDDATAPLKDVRESIPREEGSARKRFLNRLIRETKVRKSPEGGLEFLLHRGMSGDEHAAVVGPTHVTHDARTSWTPLRRKADTFAYSYGGTKRVGDEWKVVKGRVASAWVHEKHIVDVPLQHGKLKHPVDPSGPKDGHNTFKHEFEVIVDPHRSELASPNELEPTLHEEITLRAKPNTVGGQKHTPRARLNRLREQLKKTKEVLEDMQKGINHKVAPNKHPKFDDSKASPDQIRYAREWMHGDGQNIHEKRESIRPMDPTVRFRALHSLSGKTQIRRDPKTGERQFLLYRGHAENELGTGRTSWTPHAAVAADFARMVPNEKGIGHVTSAWIPDHKIVSIPKHQYLDDSKFHREHEVIVEPHDYEIQESTQWYPFVDKKVSEQSIQARLQDFKAKKHDEWADFARLAPNIKQRKE